MKRPLALTFILLPIFLTNLPAQPNYTALDSVKPFPGKFRSGINMGYQPNWTNEQLATIAAGSTALGIPGIGAKTTRPAMYEMVYASFGYNLSLYDFQAFKNLGMDEFTGVIGGPPQWNLDFTNYCAGQPSTIFKDLYLPIWDAGNGTPYNEDNPFAAYVYKLVETYKDYVTFWEIWNEPGFDFSGGNGRKQPGQPGNWWDNDPDPCDYQLKAPIEHYVRMLRISWEIIKTLDPDAYVTLGDPGFPSFLDAVLRNTDNPNDGSVSPQFPLKGGAYFDAISFHAYPHFDFTAYDPVSGIFDRHSDGAADGLLIAKDRFAQVLDTHGFNGISSPEKIWICTEYNAPRTAITGPWLNGPELQINYALKVLLKAKKEQIHQMHIYSLFDVRPEAEAIDEFDLMGQYQNNTGVVAYNQVVNPQGKALKTFTDLFGETTYDAAQTAALNLPPGVRGMAFKQQDNEFVYALWAETQTDLSEVASATYSFPGNLQLTEVECLKWDFGYSGIVENMPSTNIELHARPAFFKKHNVQNCALTASVTNILCNDNGTPTNPADDKFSFRLTVNGSGLAGNTAWNANIGGQNVLGNYGVPKNLSGFSISAGTLVFMVADTANLACATSVSVNPPGTCSNQPATQFCQSKSDFPWHEWISKVQTGTLNKISSKTPYSDFTNSSTNLPAGTTTPIAFEANFSWLTFDEYFRVWIDYDKDKVFETNELAYQGILDAPNLGITVGTLNGALDIPAGTPTGTTRMRISMKRGAYPDPCELIPFGEVEDYTVNITSGGTGTCNISANISGITCNNNGTPTIGGDDTYTFSATLTGQNTGNGWQVTVGQTVVSGSYGIPKTLGPFPIVGGTQNLVFHDLATNSCQTTQIVTPPPPCSQGGGTGTYCPSMGDFPWHDWIAQFKLADLNWTSSKSQYSSFLAQTATVLAGGTYPVQLTTGFSWLGEDEFWSIWIDFDKDGEFEQNELVFNELNPKPQFPTPLWSKNGSIQIPANVPPGVTRMRVIMKRGDVAADACGTFDFGETEDYSINILGGGGQTCQVFAQISNLSCQNAGTPGNPGDDVFSFSLTVTGAGVGSGWKTTVGSQEITGSYGAPKSLNGFLIADGNLNFTVYDVADSLCNQAVSVVPPATCSNQTGPCSSQSDFPWHDWIAKVQFSNLNQVSGKSQFSDFTAQTVNVAAGQTYPLELTTGFSWQTYHDFWRIWIDFDKDGTYEPTEIVFEQDYPAPAPGIFSFDFSGQVVIPAGVPAGNTKMRVSMKRDAFADPCETLPFGEVEDYSVVVSQSLLPGEVRQVEKTPDFEALPNLHLYPNPAGEFVRVFVGDYVGRELNVLIFNQLGIETRRVFFEKIAEPFVEIPLSGLVNGQYFLRFSSPGRRPVGKLLLVENGD